MRILIVGSGAREHALCWAVIQSPGCRKLYCAPGNFGISQLAECVPIKATDIDEITAFASAQKIDFVIVGPEQPLVAGLADKLAEAHIPVFGPSRAAAQLEGSKGYVKDLCREFNIPTAAYHRVYSLDEAQAAIESMQVPIVVKADGLAAGKGVIIAENKMVAIEAAQKLLGDGPGQHPSLVIEEFMVGEEASFFALVDGDVVIPLCAAQDHKQVFDGDKGPNTGGMGAYSPAPVVTAEIEKEILEKIIHPTANAMVKRGTPFRGVLFAGLMITAQGPKLIEYNVRFGDPECQVIMPRLDGDWLKLLHATATGKLAGMHQLRWKNKQYLGVVYAANGYPDDYVKNTEIKNLDALDGMADVMVFHAATKSDDSRVLADGGRVLSIVAGGDNIAAAQKNAYAAIGKIIWPEGFYRRDIGWRAVAREKKVA